MPLSRQTQHFIHPPHSMCPAPRGVLVLETRPQERKFNRVAREDQAQAELCAGKYKSEPSSGTNYSWGKRGWGCLANGVQGWPGGGL
jgi:hypothetical protein